MLSRYSFRWGVPLFAIGVFVTCPGLVAQTLDDPLVRQTAPDSSSFANPSFRLFTGLANRRALPGLAASRQMACSYAKCGLALSLAPLQLVRGNDLEPLGRTYFGPDVHVLLDAGGEVAEHTRRFERYNTAQYVVMYSSVALLAGAFAAFQHDDNDLLLSVVAARRPRTELSHFTETTQ